MATNALVLSTRLLQTPCARADRALVAVLDRYAAGRLEQAPRTNSVADRVRSVLGDELRGGEATAARLAARLKMSFVRHQGLSVVHETARFASYEGVWRKPRVSPAPG